MWNKDWQPPKELLEPGAHKSSTLAGKAYRVGPKKSASPTVKSPKKSKKNDSANSNPLFDFSNMDMDPPIYATAQDQLKYESAATPITTTTPTAEVSTSAFSEKDRILFALQFGQRVDVEWALDQIVHISFECPEKLELAESPFLLQLLLSLAQPCLTSHAADNALPTSATDTLNSMMMETSSHQLLEEEDTVKIKKEVATTTTTATCNNDSFSIMIPLLASNNNDNNNNDPESTSNSLGALDIILKVLHILRNFSFLTNYIPTLAQHALVKEILVQSLETSMITGHVELGRHSMDVLENIAGYMELVSENDPCLNCIYTLVAAHDRYLVIGSIRTLTWFTTNQLNHIHLKSSPVIERIAQMLLSNDEELVGTALEYIYQYTRTATESRSQFLTSPHSSAYIGLLISLLMTKSKYFHARFVQEDLLPTPNISTSEGLLQQQQEQQRKPVVPKVPDLTVYQKLDEPFRCLGWLKDKFEVADRSSVLSLDDIYLLYEARFGLEKALKMRDFYTVMKIAFPKASTTSETKPLLASPGQSSPVVEGLNILGIQIKMSILQDRKYTMCSLRRRVFHESNHISKLFRPPSTL